MTELSEKILQALKPTAGSVRGKGFMKMRDLERLVDVKERGLQAEDGEPGPLDNASEEIFRAYKYCIITKAGPHGGAKLTKDPEEIKAARNQLNAHLWHEKDKVDRYDRFLQTLAPVLV